MKTHQNTKEENIIKRTHELAVLTNPDDPHTHHTLGVYLTAIFGEHDRARSLYERAIELDPDFAHAHHNMAILLTLEFEDYEEARHEFERTLELEPKNWNAHYNYANLLSRLHGMREICYRYTIGR